ncbi:MAG: hypothetical protein IGS03_05110 [Candidatus Sericytochromatia bacterium]|nr:hypothetical protein [Candidatus Sericytochromatia bacterium]
MSEVSPHQPGHSQLVIVANGHLSYEIFRAPASQLPELRRLVEKLTPFKARLFPIWGFDEVIQELRHNKVRLGLGWDNWSGLYLMAYCEAGDRVLRELAPLLDAETVHWPPEEKT